MAASSPLVALAQNVPQLGFTRSTNQTLLFTWPATNGGFLIEESTKAADTNWHASTLLNTIFHTNNAVFTVMAPGTNAQRATGAGSGCTRPVEIWPAFSTYLNAYVLLFLANEGWFFSTSPNLLNWTTPLNFMPETIWQHCQPMDWNYIFVTPGNVPGVIGQTGYVLYAHTDAKGLGCTGGFSPHELWVRPFTFTNGF